MHAARVVSDAGEQTASNGAGLHGMAAGEATSTAQ
jgi:hypothetical protein